VRLLALVLALAGGTALSVSVPRPPSGLEAGDTWSAVAVVKRDGRPVASARVGIYVGGRSFTARPAGRGRYRAQVTLPAPGTWPYGVRVRGRSYRGGTITVRQVRLHGTYDVAVAPDGSLLIGDSSNRVLRYRNGTLEVVARLRFPVEVAPDPRGGFGVVHQERYVRHVAENGSTRVVAELEQPTAHAYAPDGTLFVSELGGRVRRVDVNGAVTTLVATGLNRPHGLAVIGATLYVCDTFDNELLATDLAGGAVRTVTRELNTPVDVAAGPDGALYVADYGNGRIARVTAAGQTTTWVSLLGANGVAVAADGTVYATERSLPRVLRVDPTTRAVTTAVGS
jgi:glucose/arabinose dehydrogenase